MKIAEVTAAIEAVAPRGYQEDWDNSGLQVGNGGVECTGVMICVDVTPAVVEEAVQAGCNLIVSHHPLIFKPLKSLTGKNPVEVAVMNAIAAGVSVYSAHTSIDNAPGGVSYTMAERLGIRVMRTLAPRDNVMRRISVMVPINDAESVRMAMFDAGAGAFGGYDCCSFNVDGSGTYMPLEGSHPYAGTQGELHDEVETRIDVLAPYWLVDRVVEAMLGVHPYECPAWEVMQPVNKIDAIGLGAYGTLQKRLKPAALIELVKKTFGSKTVRCTKPVDDDMLISRVALCGGSGGSMIGDAIAAGAQAYITSDVRYHDFVDYKDRILIIDIGHFEAEECTKDIFYQIITQKFINFAVHKSSTDTNSINYL